MTSHEHVSKYEPEIFQAIASSLSAVCGRFSRDGRAGSIERRLLGEHLGGRLLRAILTVRAVLRPVAALPAGARERREELEARVRPLEPPTVLGHEQRDRVLAVPVLLTR